jgi:hypothetical protein
MKPSEHMLPEHLFRTRDCSAVFQRIALDRAGCRQFGITETRGKAGESFFENAEKAILLALLRR